MESILRIEQIEKYYGNKLNLTKAIDNISFDVDEGEFVAIMGASGSGKTTWIRKNVRKYLLQNPNDNVLCITYTNRAAEELGKDVDSNRVYFGTIHSFINDFIGSFFSHESILELYWEVYKNQIVERIENISQRS